MSLTTNQVDDIRRTIAINLGIPMGDVVRDMPLTGAAVDSLDFIEAVMSLEDDYEISMDDDKLQSLVTVGDLLDYAATLVA